jgi:16S rRNA (uracil1498-N3)-methyltransferase
MEEIVRMGEDMPHREVFFVPPGGITGDEVRFPPEEAKHIAVVLRHRSGDVVWAADGAGTAHEVSLVSVERREVRGRILRSEPGAGEPSVSVVLAAGALKGERFDWLVEKATELGASRIVPFLSEGTSVGRPSSGKTDRWRKIALAAMKQCGRCVRPDVSDAVSLDEVVRSGADFDLAVAAHGGPDCVTVGEAVRAAVSPVRRALLVTGPEGGFFPGEIEAFRRSGFFIVTLGPRRLRSETAALALLAQVFMLVGVDAGA